MKKYTLILVLLLSISPYLEAPLAYAACDGSSPGVQIVVDAAGGVTYVCPATATTGAGVTTVAGQSTGGGQPAVTTVQTQVPAATTPATTNTACPNGGTLNANGTCNLGYTPLEPIPGLSPTNGVWDLTSPAGFAAFINALFTILISAGALIAVLMLTLGGVQYMTSSSVGNKTAGLDRAKAALWGILLIAGIWLILNTINPQLLNFNFIACPGNSCGTAASTNTGLPAPPAPNVSSMTAAQIQAAQSSGAIGNLVNTQNNTFTFTNGSAGNTDLNSQFATWSTACTAAHGSIQSGPQENNGGTLTMVCAQQ